LPWGACGAKDSSGRVRHIKRCPNYIECGDFKQPDSRRAEFGESDREFYLTIRLLLSAVGLKPFF
jgi:hypothetical protein